MGEIVDFPTISGELVWITGTKCEHCDCNDCRDRNLKLFIREHIQQVKFRFRPPIHEGCDCRLAENRIHEEKSDYREYRRGIRRIRKLRLDE